MFSISLSESIEITVYSSSFTIDTVLPEIELIEPGHGDIYEHGEIIEVSWLGSDQSPASLPVTIHATAYLNSPYQEIASDILNAGTFNLPAPDFINSMFVSIRLDFIDYYGNISSSYSEGYFTIGTPNETQYEFETETFSGEFISSTFTIDTDAPDVTWVYPNEYTTFQPSQPLVVRWESEDENLIDNPIDLFFEIDAGNLSFTLEENIANTGVRFINLPDTTTQLGQFIVESTDSYGNVGLDASDAYIVVGQEETDDFEQITTDVTVYSSSFTVDTKVPEFLTISGDNYFYPNGGETLTDYSNVPIEFAARDDSDQNATVDVYLAYILGGWYIPISSTSNYTDMSLGGLVESSIWARLIFEATDDYGNTTQQYNNDYFVLGSSEGEIGINWYNEDAGEILLDWGWNGRIHTVGIRLAASADYLEVGDQITYVDLNGIPSSSCDDENGFVELYNFAVSDVENQSKQTLLKAINHCEQGGEKRPGYLDGNLIYLKVTPVNGDSSYLVLPDSTQVGGSHRFNDTYSVIRNIDFANPIPLNNNIINPMGIDERDFDGFSIYNKVTSVRDCDTPGEDENEGWCFEETVYDQTSYTANIPYMQESVNVKYRVWLLDNNGTEVLKTLDTEGIDIYYVELDDIYDKSLAFGWNWFSLNMSADDMAINTTLSSLSDAGIYIKSQSQYSSYYDEAGWLGTLTDFDNLSMYKINLTGSSGNITYEGTSLVPSEVPLSLSIGWNWISYVPNESLDINTALASIGSDGIYIKTQSGYANYYDEAGWLGTLSTLEPKDGYMINVTNGSTLTYPDPGSFLSSHMINEEPSINEYHWSFDYKDFQNNGSATIVIDDSDLNVEVGDQIGAFYNNQCRGVAIGKETSLSDKIIFHLMFYGDENEANFNFKYYDVSENIVHDLENEIIYYPDIHLNNILEPLSMGKTEVLSLKLNNPYPNPFNPVTTIPYSIPEDVANLRINIYDITGRLVDQIYKGNQTMGNHKLLWNASRYASGIYFVKMITGNDAITRKLVLIK